MLRILGESVRLCDGIRRRELLRVGGLIAAGLALPDLLRGGAAPGAAGGVRGGGSRVPGGWRRAARRARLPLRSGADRLGMGSARPLLAAVRLVRRARILDRGE